MNALSKLFEVLHLSRGEMTLRRSHRRRRSRRQGSALSCETLESKQLLAADLVAPISADPVVVTDAPVAISLEGKFQDTAVSGTVVKFETNAPLADNDFYVELTSNTPLTNTNFLSYVNSGVYDNSQIHRSVSGFVIQGGGFKVPTVAADQPGSDPVAIPTTGTVQNESGNPNTRGTIAMAKLSNQPDSATSQFFFNLSDNSFLDSDNGGFTQFGSVLGSGLTVVDTLASALTYDATTYYSNTALSDLPLWNVNQDNIVRPQDFVQIENADEVTESALFTYQVSSSDAAKLTASLDGNGNLLLTPVGDASGSVNVTVTATSKLDNSTDSDVFSVQLNGGGGGPVAPVLTAIEEVGAITLNRNAAGVLFAGDTELSIAGRSATLNRYSHLTFIGAETVDGVNRVISRKTSDNTLRIWQFDSTWTYTGGEQLNDFSGAALGQLETAFNSDLNEDSSIGAWSVENLGAIELRVSAAGVLFAGDTELSIVGRSATLNRYSHLTFIGAETVDGVNRVISRKTSDNTLRIWQFDSTWTYTGGEQLNDFSGAALGQLETAFNSDLNEDSSVGDWSVENLGAIELRVSAAGVLFAGDTELSIVGRSATLNRYSHLTFIGAETVDGVNRVISRKTSDNTLRIWQFDSTWTYTGGEQLNDFSGAALGQLETAFNSDLNEDQAIGGPVTPVLTAIEEVGAITLNRNAAGVLFAGDTELSIVGRSATLNRYSHLTFIGAETVDGVNRVISRKTSDNTLRIWQFDSTWTYTGGEQLNDFSGAALGQLETAFNSDLNEDSSVGDWSVENLGAIELRVSAAGVLFAGDTELSIVGRSATLNRYSHLTFIGAETVDGVNRVISRKTSDNTLRIWQFDSTWTYTGGEQLNDFSGAALGQLETAFNSDLNEDQAIG